MAASRMSLTLLQTRLLRIKNNISVLSVKNISNDSWVPQEKKTHTGQAWEADDYRLARFVDKPKQINTKFAIDLIAATPPKPREQRVVWCDGGGGPTGHPRVYINLDKPGNHICGYCGLRFFKEDHH